MSGNGPVPGEYVEVVDHMTTKVHACKSKWRSAWIRRPANLFLSEIGDDVDDESLLISLEFEEVENQLDSVWNDVSFCVHLLLS